MTEASRWPPRGRAGRALGIGVMRLPFASEPERARATIAAALELGVTVFDTARAYGEACERGLADVLRGLGAAHRVSVVSKAGMRREGARWRPDGRARSIDADVAATSASLGDIPIGMLLIHAPDPAVPWATTLRALARAHAVGRVDRIGVSNVSRAELDQALELAPISAVEVAISPFDEAALTGGVVARALDCGLSVLVHAPFGGPPRAPRLLRDKVLGAPGASPYARVLAALLDLDPAVVPLPGPTRPQTVGAIGEALALSSVERDAAEAKLGWRRKLRPPPRPTARRPGEVVVVMGLPGAGKSTVAEALEAEGHARLNRDERGGSLAALHAELDARLGAGEQRFVLDNLYLTRAGRRAVLDVCARHAVGARLLWIDAPLVEAQRNVTARVVALSGALPEPDALAQSKRAGVFGPNVLLRAARELEPPTEDEGFQRIERRRFERTAPKEARTLVRLVAVDAALDARGSPYADDALLWGPEPTLVFGWRGALDAPTEEALRVRAARALDGAEGVTHRAQAPLAFAMCSHGGGPPRCWCRPPLLGLVLAWAPPSVDWGASVLVGTGPTHAAMARTLGTRYVMGRTPAGGSRRSAGSGLQT